MASAKSAYLGIEGVDKSLGQTKVIDNLTLSVGKGDLIGLLGPSGSGKTTLLNIIAGFIAPDAGSIRIDGQEISDLPPYLRDIGITFQRYALFPHLDVFENVAYGLRRRHVPKRRIVERVAHILALLKMEGFERRYPKQLSGGEQQRVALARALVVEPRLMLLDEPLANLDAALRRRVRFDIREVLRKTEVTSIFVTHDQEEAFTLCDRVAVLWRGRIQQIGTPTELMQSPCNAFVAGFIGHPNILDATVKEYEPRSRIVCVDINGLIAHALAPRPIHVGGRARVFVKPENVKLQFEDAPDDSGCRIKDWIHFATGWEISIGGRVELRTYLPDRAIKLDRGSTVRPSWNPEDAHAFGFDDISLGHASEPVSTAPRLSDHGYRQSSGAGEH